MDEIITEINRIIRKNLDGVDIYKYEINEKTLDIYYIIETEIFGENEEFINICMDYILQKNKEIIPNEDIIGKLDENNGNKQIIYKIFVIKNEVK